MATAAIAEVIDKDKKETSKFRMLASSLLLPAVGTCYIMKRNQKEEFIC